MLSALRQRTASLRLAMWSGDWIPVSLPDRWRALQPNTQLISLGGATEGSIWSIFYPIEQVDATWPSIPYGRVLTHQQMYVLDDALKPCPAGIAGEIFIGGAGVARGYINRAELTAERFLPDPFQPQINGKIYKTGDLGRTLQNGNIQFLGRADHQVKINGFRVELSEIELVIKSHPAVKEALVLCCHDSSKRPYLVAYYQTDRVETDENRGAQIGTKNSQLWPHCIYQITWCRAAFTRYPTGH